MVEREDIAAPERNPGERGHLIVGLAILIAVLLIMLTAAAQSWTFLMKRDREAELIFRGEQYAKAIQFYRKEMNQFPLKLDQLLDKGPHRHGFIRRLWPDPVAKDGEWGLLYLSPTGKGFLNPYASQGAQIPGAPGANDPFGTALNPATGPLGQKPRGSPRPFGDRNSRNKPKVGYTEMTRAELEKRGISGMNLPIVGVVHKKMEEGVKIYKGYGTLNDWAFTLMDEGQEINKGGGQRWAPPTRSTRNFGVGDSASPIFTPGMREMPTEAEMACSGNPQQLMECMRRKEAIKRGEDPNAPEEVPLPPHCDPEDPNHNPDELNIDCIRHCIPDDPSYNPDSPKCYSWCYKSSPNHDPNAPECKPD